MHASRFPPILQFTRAAYVSGIGLGIPVFDPKIENMNTLATVQRIIADQTGLFAMDLQPTRPLEELGIDSLTVIESMFLLEDEFKVEIPGGQAPIRTIQDIADLVEQLLLKRDSANTEPATP